VEGTLGHKAEAGTGGVDSTGGNQSNKSNIHAPRREGVDVRGVNVKFCTCKYVVNKCEINQSIIILL
jgi:hypothetical protein